MNKESIEVLIKKTRAAISFFDALAGECEEAQNNSSRYSMIGSLVWSAKMAKSKASECLDYLKECKEEAEK